MGPRGLVCCGNSSVAQLLGEHAVNIFDVWVSQIRFAVVDCFLFCLFVCVCVCDVLRLVDYRIFAEANRSSQDGNQQAEVWKAGPAETNCGE